MDVTGADIARRRRALGMDRKALAAEAGVDRGTLTRIEDDPGYRWRDTTMAAIVRTLERIEEEVGVDELEASLVTVTLDLPGGGRAVVKGDAAGVAEAVAKLLQQMGGDAR
jgi:predicted transcriptional regulator